ncbi:VOC family protein [Oceanicella sp. SM1341]|uniref:VOC family protein n=1 Tax=Oceanicella sp. SM1341 TaxID=1548889 RepID=UPI001E5D7094|nr:VOC family protein [Oceanicella sp. SM1341]
MTSANRFVWYELMTSDLPAAATFYTGVLGWDIRDAGMPDFDYRLASSAGGMRAGLMGTPSEAQGMPPFWSGYVGVTDVEEMSDRLKAAGGAVHRPATDIPGVGRFAVVADPQGAIFCLFQPNDGTDGSGPPAPEDEAGTVGWQELYAEDMPAVTGFYETLFGWRLDTLMDMGEMGGYQIFLQKDDVPGGMMTRPAAVPRPCWQYYFRVSALDAAAARITEGGGTVLMGPHLVPGDTWVLQATDPQGAHFGLLSASR